MRKHRRCIVNACASFCNSGLYVENIAYVTTGSFLFQIFNHTGKYSRRLRSCCICIRQKAAVVIAFHKQVCSCPAYSVSRITGNRAAVRVCPHLPRVLGQRKHQCIAAKEARPQAVGSCPEREARKQRPGNTPTSRLVFGEVRSKSRCGESVGDELMRKGSDTSDPFDFSR